MIGEVLGDLLPVVGGEVIITATLEPLGQVSHSTNNIVFVHLEIGVVIEGVAVDSVGLIDEVPSGLEAVIALDVVGESSTLNEGVVDFTGNQVRVRFFENVQLGKSSVQDSGVLSLEEVLGLCSDYTRWLENVCQKQVENERENLRSWSFPQVWKFENCCRTY